MTKQESDSGFDVVVTPAGEDSLQVNVTLQPVWPVMKSYGPSGLDPLMKVQANLAQAAHAGMAWNLSLEKNVNEALAKGHAKLKEALAKDSKGFSMEAVQSTKSKMHQQDLIEALTKGAVVKTASHAELDALAVAHGYVIGTDLAYHPPTEQLSSLQKSLGHDPATGLHIIAIGPQGGKIVGYGHGAHGLEPIYAGSAAAHKLVLSKQHGDKGSVHLAVLTWLEALGLVIGKDVHHDGHSITMSQAVYNSLDMGPVPHGAAGPVKVAVASLLDFVGKPIVPPASASMEHAAEVAAGEAGDKDPFPPLHTLVKQADAGKYAGSHGNQLWLDPKGNKFVFKPTDLVIARSEEAASRIGTLVLGEGKIPHARVVQLGKQHGALIKVVDGEPIGKESSGAVDSKLVEFAPQIAAHAVVDWLISNHDGHGANLLVQGKKLIGIDKGQAGKFLGNDKLDGKYQPNPSPTVANKLWALVASGKGDKGAILDAVVKACDAADKISDDQYRLLIAPQIDAKVKAFGANAKVLEGAALGRKHSLRADFTKLLSQTFGTPVDLSVKTSVQAAQPKAPAGLAHVTVKAPDAPPAFSVTLPKAYASIDKISITPTGVEVQGVEAKPAGWPITHKNVTVHHPGTPPPLGMKWPGKYPGPGYHGEVKVGGKTFTFNVMAVKPGDKDPQIHVTMPDGQAVIYDGWPLACASTALFNKGLPLDTSFAKQKELGIGVGGPKLLALDHFGPLLAGAGSVEASAVEPKPAKTPAKIIEPAPAPVDVTEAKTPPGASNWSWFDGKLYPKASIHQLKLEAAPIGTKLGWHSTELTKVESDSWKDASGFSYSTVDVADIISTAKTDVAYVEPAQPEYKPTTQIIGKVPASFAVTSQNLGAFHPTPAFSLGLVQDLGQMPAPVQLAAHKAKLAGAPGPGWPQSGTVVHVENGFVVFGPTGGTVYGMKGSYLNSFPPESEWLVEALGHVPDSLKTPASAPPAGPVVVAGAAPSPSTTLALPATPYPSGGPLPSFTKVSKIFNGEKYELVQEPDGTFTVSSPESFPQWGKKVASLSSATQAVIDKEGAGGAVQAGDGWAFWGLKAQIEKPAIKGPAAEGITLDDLPPDYDAKPKKTPAKIIAPPPAPVVETSTEMLEGSKLQAVVGGAAWYEALPNGAQLGWTEVVDGTPTQVVATKTGGKWVGVWSDGAPDTTWDSGASLVSQLHTEAVDNLMVVKQPASAPAGAESVDNWETMPPPADKKAWLDSLPWGTQIAWNTSAGAWEATKQADGKWQTLKPNTEMVSTASSGFLDTFLSEHLSDNEIAVQKPAGAITPEVQAAAKLEIKEEPQPLQTATGSEHSKPPPGSHPQVKTAFDLIDAALKNNGPKDLGSVPWWVPSLGKWLEVSSPSGPVLITPISNSTTGGLVLTSVNAKTGAVADGSIDKLASVHGFSVGEVMGIAAHDKNTKEKSTSSSSLAVIPFIDAWEHLPEVKADSGFTLKPGTGGGVLIGHDKKPGEASETSAAKLHALLQKYGVQPNKSKTGKATLFGETIGASYYGAWTYVSKDNASKLVPVEMPKAEQSAAQQAFPNASYVEDAPASPDEGIAKHYAGGNVTEGMLQALPIGSTVGWYDEDSDGAKVEFTKVAATADNPVGGWHKKGNANLSDDSGLADYAGLQNEVTVIPGEGGPASPTGPLSASQVQALSLPWMDAQPAGTVVHGEDDDGNKVQFTKDAYGGWQKNGNVSLTEAKYVLESIQNNLSKVVVFNNASAAPGASNWDWFTTHPITDEDATTKKILESPPGTKLLWTTSGGTSFSATKSGEGDSWSIHNESTGVPVGKDGAATTLATVFVHSKLQPGSTKVQAPDGSVVQSPKASGEVIPKHLLQTAHLQAYDAGTVLSWTSAAGNPVTYTKLPSGKWQFGADTSSDASSESLAHAFASVSMGPVTISSVDYVITPPTVQALTTDELEAAPIGVTVKTKDGLLYTKNGVKWVAHAANQEVLHGDPYGLHTKWNSDLEGAVYAPGAAVSVAKSHDKPQKMAKNWTAQTIAQKLAKLPKGSIVSLASDPASKYVLTPSPLYSNYTSFPVLVEVGTGHILQLQAFTNLKKDQGIIVHPAVAGADLVTGQPITIQAPAIKAPPKPKAVQYVPTPVDPLKAAKKTWAKEHAPLDPQTAKHLGAWLDKMGIKEAVHARQGDHAILVGDGTKELADLITTLSPGAGTVVDTPWGPMAQLGDVSIVHATPEAGTITGPDGGLYPHGTTFTEELVPAAKLEDVVKQTPGFKKVDGYNQPDKKFDKTIKWNGTAPSALATAQAFKEAHGLSGTPFQGSTNTMLSVTNAELEKPSAPTTKKVVAKQPAPTAALNTKALTGISSGVPPVGSHAQDNRSDLAAAHEVIPAHTGYGIRFGAGGLLLDGQLRVYKLRLPNGQEVTRITGQLTKEPKPLDPSIPFKMLGALKNGNSTLDTTTGVAQLTNDTIWSGGEKISSSKILSGDAKLSVFVGSASKPGDSEAMRKTFVVDVPKGVDPEKAIAESMAALGHDVDDAMRPLGADDELLLKKMLAVRSIVGPTGSQVIEKMNLSSLTLAQRHAKLDQRLSASGYSPDQIAAMPLKVAEGGMHYLEMDDLDSKLGKQISCLARGVELDGLLRFFKQNGAVGTQHAAISGNCPHFNKLQSAVPDMLSGGTAGVHFRMMGPGSPEFGNVGSGQPKLLLKPSVLKSSEWYAHDGDAYGTQKHGSVTRKTVHQLSSYSNEVILMNVSRDDFAGLLVRTESEKATAVAALKGLGIDGWNGIHWDQFVVVASNVDAVHKHVPKFALLNEGK